MRGARESSKVATITAAIVAPTFGNLTILQLWSNHHLLLGTFLDSLSRGSPQPGGGACPACEPFEASEIMWPGPARATTGRTRSSVNLQQADAQVEDSVWPENHVINTHTALGRERVPYACASVQALFVSLGSH